VSALVLWVAALTPPIDQRSEEEQKAVALVDEYLGANWGDGTAMRVLVGAGAPANPAVDELFARLERYAATPSAAQAVIRRSFGVDTRAIRSAVGVPTMIVVHPDDPVVSVEMARDTARDIPGARLVETKASGHISWDLHEQEDLDIIEEFLTGSRQHREANRKLVTVLITDIVGSTELAFELGDKRWASLLDQHDSAARVELQRFRGRELGTMGDGFFAAFDGPARAVECAHAIRRRARVLGLDVRAGVHAGECEIRGDQLVGVTLHVAARVSAQADAGEVLVSRVVRDLVDGGNLGFESRGYHALKGVPDKIELFEAFITAEGPSRRRTTDSTDP
jgi:class 3 adenylate cyclase